MNFSATEHERIVRSLLTESGTTSSSYLAHSNLDADFSRSWTSESNEFAGHVLNKSSMNVSSIGPLH